MKVLADQLHRGPRATTRGVFPTPEPVHDYVASRLKDTFDGVSPNKSWVGWFLWQLVIDIIRPCTADTSPGRVAAAICRLLAVDDRPLDQQLEALTSEQAAWVLRATHIIQPQLSRPSGSLKVRVALAYVGQPAGRSFSGDLHPEQVETTVALWRVIRACLDRPDVTVMLRQHAGWLLAQGNEDPGRGVVRPRRRPGVTGSLGIYLSNPLDGQAPDLAWVDEALLPSSTTAAVGTQKPQPSPTTEGQDFFARLQSASLILETGLYMTRQAAALDIIDMADSNQTRRQACTDLLCSYIRNPLAESPRDRAIDNEVRGTIITSIRDRLLPDAKISWQGCNLNFTGAIIESGDLSHAVFSGGIVYFDDVRFDARWFSFDNAAFVGGTVSFTGAQFNGRWMSFAQAVFDGATVWFTNAAATNPAGTLTFRQARFISGHIGMENLTIADGCTLLTDEATGDVSLLEHAPQQLVETLSAPTP